jgi:general secretion pathway protein I
MKKMRQDRYQVTGDRWQVTGKETSARTPRPSPPVYPHATRYTLHASSQHGFTLLEVMIAMAILAIVLVTVFHSQSQSIAMANESRAMTTLALLAQSRMAEVEGQQNLSTGQTSGKFGDDYPDYSWTASISQPQGPGSSFLRKIEITVVHDFYPKRPYKVILYRPATLSKQ